MLNTLFVLAAVALVASQSSYDVLGKVGGCSAGWVQGAPAHAAQLPAAAAARPAPPCQHSRLARPRPPPAQVFDLFVPQLVLGSLCLFGMVLMLLWAAHGVQVSRREQRRW